MQLCNHDWVPNNVWNPTSEIWAVGHGASSKNQYMLKKRNMFVKLLGPDLQNIYSTQSLSSSAPGLLASGIGSWPTCYSRATRSNATAVKEKQRVQSCLRLCRILQCHEIQGKHSAHTPLHTHTHRESLWSAALALGRGVSWHFDYEFCITYMCVFLKCMTIYTHANQITQPRMHNSNCVSTAE